MSFKKLLFAVSIISTCLSSEVFAGRSISFRPSGAVGNFDQSLGKTITKAIPISSETTSTEEEISTSPVQHKFTRKSKSQPFKSGLLYQKPTPRKFSEFLEKTVTKAIPIASTK